MINDGHGHRIRLFRHVGGWVAGWAGGRVEGRLSRAQEQQLIFGQAMSKASSAMRPPSWTQHESPQPAPPMWQQEAPYRPRVCFEGTSCGRCAQVVRDNHG